MSEDPVESSYLSTSPLTGIEILNPGEKQSSPHVAKRNPEK